MTHISAVSCFKRLIWFTDIIKSGSQYHHFDKNQNEIHPLTVNLLPLLGKLGFPGKMWYVDNWPPHGLGLTDAVQRYIILPLFIEMIDWVHGFRSNWISPSYIPHLTKSYKIAGTILDSKAPSQYKDSLYGHGHFHVNDKTVVRPSYL